MRGEKNHQPCYWQRRTAHFKREFLTFIDCHLLFFNVRFVELIHIKERGGAGKAQGDTSTAGLVSHCGAGDFFFLELLLGGKFNRKEGGGDEMRLEGPGR